MKGRIQTSLKAPVSAAVAALAVAVTASGTVQTTQCLLPSIPLDKFGVQFAFDCVSFPAGVILQTRADIHYLNDPGDDAADLMLSIQAPPEGQPVWNITGADFGWSGDGVFTADITTDALNGVIDLGNPPPDFSLFVVTIQMQGGQPLAGRFVMSTFNIDILVKPCPWDLDFDGEVGITDFLALLGAWGDNPGVPPDFDSNGVVDIADFLELLANWGACP
ncbi:MAG: hypothetical protein IID28_04830 [Planctomycetes bacterium]|nr:hypothetical protein [Planctomycetota bacterium]